MSAKNEVLLLKKITKEKAGERILDQFFLEILSGEIINLIGLEGSGHQEICSMLFGEESRQSGEIWFMGKKYASEKSLPVERANGIFFIGNDRMIIPNFSVAENMYVVEKVNYAQFCVPHKKMVQQARILFQEFGIDIAPERKAKELNKFETYVLRLMRAYIKRARLIVIDDIIDDRSFEKLQQIIDILNRFKQEGISILWVNSYPDSITEIADKVVVIRKGRTGITFYHDEYSKNKVLDRLIGKENFKSPERQSEKGDKYVFEADGIQNEYFDRLSFQCREGEILGIYDLQNKFSRELRRLLLGKRSYEGCLKVEGKPVQVNSDYKLVQNRIGVVDGNNYSTLIFPELSVHENIEMAIYKKAAIYKFFITRRLWRYFDKLGKEICRQDNISEASKLVNRQDTTKIIYNRLYLTKPKVLFCFQPFLHLDAISRKELEKILVKFCQDRAGVVLSSANISDLLLLCDRILIVEKNKIIKEAERKAFLDFQ